MNPKILTIGLDGATLNLIKPWAAAGLLPNFNKMIQEGVTGELTSTIHPLSPPAWSSFMTGKNPGKHGVYDFVVHEPNSYKISYTNGSFIKGQTLWNLMSQAGRSVIVVNVPMTYPPEPVNGVLVSGFDTPGSDSDFTFPLELKNEIQREIGEYAVRDYPHNCDPASFLTQIHHLIDIREQLAHYLLVRYPWDFFVTVFNATDLVQHAFWQYMDTTFAGINTDERLKFRDAILNVYQRMDRLLGEVIRQYSKEARIFVMSDHGAGPAYKVIFLNQWLKEEGFLTYNEQNGKSHLARLPLSLLKIFHAGIRKQLPPRYIDFLIRSFPKLRRIVKSHLTFSEINWQKTLAYAFGRESASIFVNLKGRFPGGIVEPGPDYNKLLKSLKQRLLELTDPDSRQPIVEYVYRRDEVYHGDFLDCAPDLLIVWKNHEYTCRPGYDDQQQSIFASSLKHSEMSEISQLKKGGTHTPEGILMAMGEGLKTGVKISGARLIDLAPTFLYQLDVPVPKDMDGRILTELFTQEVVNAKSPIYTNKDSSACKKGEVYSETEAETIRRRLEGLGYL